MGSRCIVKWYDITIMENRVAITEPILIENTGQLPNPITPENAEENASTKTGDNIKVLLLLFAMIISGGIIVRYIRRCW